MSLDLALPCAHLDDLSVDVFSHSAVALHIVVGIDLHSSDGTRTANGKATSALADSVAHAIPANLARLAELFFSLIVERS